MKDNEISVTAVLPETINSFEYVRNHHFVRFGSKDGKTLKLIPQGQMMYRCRDCDFFCYADSNHGSLPCPKCKTVDMERKWMRAQTLMVPEAESDFEWPQTETDSKKTI